MTIKRNGDKVILKDGKVSCSCCGCCMYAVRAYTDGLYAFEDLPDELIMYHNDTIGGSVAGPITFSKNAQPGGQYFYGGSGLDPRIIYFPDEWIAGINQIDPGIGECLIMDKFNITPTPASGPERTIWIFDNFADAYTVNGPISGTVTRESLCVWRGNNLTLRYDRSLNNNFEPIGTFKWKVNGNNKSGLQNTPVGSYAGGFTVS